MNPRLSLWIYMIMTHGLLFGQTIVSEMPIVSENGILKSRRVNLCFNENVIQTPSGISLVDVSRWPIQDSDVRQLVDRLAAIYGTPRIKKTIPRLVWGDTLVTNRRTGIVSRAPDMSQDVVLDFPVPVPLDSVLDEFRRLPVVRYANGPISIRTLTEPDDPYFVNGDQWNLEKIQAPQAWDITTGSSAIRIAIIDQSGGTGCCEFRNHEDLEGKFIGGDGVPGHPHAGWVASIAAASTNNGLGVAGVDWNAMLMDFHFNENDADSAELRLPRLIDMATDQGADVMNLSMGTIDHNGCWTSYDGVRDALEIAFLRGVVITAAAGGDPQNLPCPQIPYFIYPAAYDEWVIAVSATNEYDEFVVGWNYGDFVDVAAPGAENIWGVATPPNSYSAHHGTSASAPHVAGLASLMLSLDQSLDPGTVRSIICQTADKVDAVRFPYVDGWNDRLGYGRINAYKAVLLTLARLNKSTLSTATAYGSARKALHESGILKAVFQSGEQLVYTSSTDGGSTWTGQLFINGNVLLGPNSNPSLLSRSGNLHSVFLDNGSSFYYIKTANGDWQSPHLLHETSALGTTSPSFAVDNAGFGHVTWVQTNIVRGATYYWVRHGTFNTADADPSLSNITTIYTSTSQSTSPSIAVNSSNKPHVVWSVNGEVYYSNKVSGSWSTALNISNNAGASTRPAVATDGSKIFVAWQDATPTKTEVYYRKRSGAGVWDPSVTNISNSPTTSSNNPTIAFTTGFSAPYVAWEEEQNSLQLAFPPDIKVKRADQPGSGTNISNTGGVSAYPALAIEPQAGYCIWTEGSNIPYQVMATPIFESLGPEGGVPSGAGSFSTQSFPNPFNPLTRIQYRLPRDVHVTLKVYDALGREVATLVNEFRTAGTHEAVFDATLLATGVYFYRLQAGDFVQARKLLLIK